VITKYNLNSIIVILPADSVKGSLRLIDGHGAILFKQNVSGQQRLKILINKLLKGNYFEQYITSDGQQSEHIVMLK